jgi:transposase
VDQNHSTEVSACGATLRKRPDRCRVGHDRTPHAGSQASGRPRSTDLRAVVDAILYMARTGCQWRLLPKDFPPFTTVQGYFYDWRDSDLFERINFERLSAAGQAAGREASPSAGVIDSQSVKTTESGGRCRSNAA